MSFNSKPFIPKLPARIAGIVFWVLALIGSIVAVFLLHSAESEIEERNFNNARLLAYELTSVYEMADKQGDYESLKGRLNLKINRLRDEMGYSAIYLNAGDKGTMFGTPRESDDVVTQELFVHQNDSGSDMEVSFSAFFPNSKMAVSEIRKTMLLGIGASIFIFGYLLQRILQKVLTVPFVNMVRTAEEFSLGNEEARFDDSRQDEFGYLGGFINNAIESVLEQQDELINALDRASKSEFELNVEKERAEVTLYSIADSVITVNTEGKVDYINPAAEKLLAISNEEATGKPYNELVSIVIESSEVLEEDLLQECFVTGEIINFPDHASIINNDTSLIAVEGSIAPMKDEDGEFIGAAIVVQDVSNTRKLTRQLSYQASHDVLTGLYNRRKFEERLSEALFNVVEENREHALLYLDLDQFKIVNDTCGHIAGDELLQQLPVLFHRVFRVGDVIARLGGDEFGILLENCSLEQAATIADKVREQIKDFRFVWEDKTFEIGVSIGVVAISSDNANMAQIMSSADIACYAAKDAGRNRVHIYEASDAAVTERYGEMHWTSRITKAMEEDRFRLYKQTIVGISHDTTEHMEVLLRMIDENGKIIPPGAFLPAAERYNLMSGIDRWVISEVFKLISCEGLSKATNGDMKVISVNLSGDSLSDDSMLPFIIAEKDKYEISLESVCFEITETIAISNLSKATRLIEELTKYGCRFALDDFGSGLSSFTYLKNLPVQYLKIDGSFVRDVSRDEIDKAMVKSIQQVGKAMDLLTIAEWVEDEETLDILKELGVDYAQGYHLGKPEAI